MIYKLNQNKDYSKIKRVSLESIGWKEKDLENLLSRHINDFICSNLLLTIFTERAYNEEPDILALDKNGDLYIFELKRWGSNKENILQVLRYGQLYGPSDYDELNDLYSKYVKGNDDLKETHKRYFELRDDEALSCEDFNRNQHFIIITNGLDQETIEAISYWKKKGLNMDAIIYWVFEEGETHYIEFNVFSPIEGYLEYESNNYILNTNYRNNKQAAIDMVNQGKAAAFSSGWKEKITRLQKGDIVFLYQNGEGIVGYGSANGILEKSEDEEEYFMHLNNYIRLENPISPSKMKTMCNKGFPFLQTMYRISDECKDIFVNEISKRK